MWTNFGCSRSSQLHIYTTPTLHTYTTHTTRLTLHTSHHTYTTHTLHTSHYTPHTTPTPHPHYTSTPHPHYTYTTPTLHTYTTPTLLTHTIHPHYTYPTPTLHTYTTPTLHTHTTHPHYTPTLHLPHTHRASSILYPCASGVCGEELGWLPGIPGGRHPHSELGPEPRQGGGDPIPSRQGHSAGLYVRGLPFPIHSLYSIPLSVCRPLHCSVNSHNLLMPVLFLSPGSPPLLHYI